MNKNYIVTKSNYFIMNSSYDLNLEEQKLILTLASMVQPEDKEFKPYIFKISEFMKLLGVSNQCKYTDTPKITKELMKKVFEIEEDDTLIQTAWLSSATYKKGTGMVELEFSPRLKPYMLQLKEKFTQYKLGNILAMKSKYSPRIYEILKCNEFKKQGYIQIEIDDLKKILHSDNVYPRYYDFKRRVIEQSQKELKKMSDISFDFEEIKTGRTVTSLKFYIKVNELTALNTADDEVSATLMEVKENPIKKIMAIMCNSKITSLEAKKLNDTAKGDINMIREKYVQAQNVAKIGSIVGWMITALKEDYKTTKDNLKVDKFNDYEQRTYDFEKLEKRLLGWDDEETVKATGEEFEQLSIR